MGLVGYTDASGVFHEAVSDAISTDADNALGHGTDGGLYVSASGGNANVKYYETDAQAEADYAAGNIPNDTSVIIRGTKPASDPELHKSDIATLAQIAGGTTTDGKVASAEDVYELNNSLSSLLKIQGQSVSFNGGVSYIPFDMDNNVVISLVASPQHTLSVNYYNRGSDTIGLVAKQYGTTDFTGDAYINIWYIPKSGHTN